MNNSVKKSSITKRIVSLTMAVCMLLCLIPATVSAEETQQKNYVALGDSISTGYGLGEGEKPFTQLVAEANSYNLQSFAQDGATTSTLLAKLSEQATIAALSTADVVTITIGGNDFVGAFFAYVARSYNADNEGANKTAEDIKNDILGNNFIILNYALTIAEGFGSSEEAQATIQQVQTNFPQIITTIKTINPQALVILTNQYNPYSFSVGELQGTDSYTLQFKALEAALDKGIQNINAVVGAMCVQMGCSVADIYTAFDAAESNPCNPSLSMMQLNLDFHPNAYGHTLIAETINAMLVPEVVYEMGDVNHDGQININDVTLIQLYLANMMPENFDPELADLNNSGDISIFDATLLQIKISSQSI